MDGTLDWYGPRTIIKYQKRKSGLKGNRLFLLRSKTEPAETEKVRFRSKTVVVLVKFN